eukprot:768263-Hanusia_phi.AAC.2
MDARIVRKKQQGSYDGPRRRKPKSGSVIEQRKGQGKKRTASSSWKQSRRVGREEQGFIYVFAPVCVSPSGQLEKRSFRPDMTGKLAKTSIQSLLHHKTCVQQSAAPASHGGGYFLAQMGSARGWVGWVGLVLVYKFLLNPINSSLGAINRLQTVARSSCSGPSVWRIADPCNRP